MGFLDNLAANPGGGSGIYGQPPPQSDDAALNVVNHLKDREMRDFKEKSNFMADLSLKQERMRALFDPNNSNNAQAPPQNVQLAQEPGAINPLQKAELGIKQQGMNLESQKLGQQGRFSQEALDIKSNQEKLNQQKSDQINQNKKDDMQRKIDESGEKIRLATEALNSKNTSAEATLKAHQDLAAAVEERHKLEMAMKDHNFKTISDQHQQTIDSLKERLKQGSRTKTTIEQGGEKRTTTTEKGDAADTVTVTGKDGKQYTIPKDKLNDMDADGTPHWQQPGDDGSQQDDGE